MVAKTTTMRDSAVFRSVYGYLQLAALLAYSGQWVFGLERYVSTAEFHGKHL